jgi:hypothetical protein
MKRLSCAAARTRLQAFHDRELAVPEQIAVEAHVTACDACAREAETLRRLGAALREVAATLHPRREELDELAGLAGGVVSRVTAESAESLQARFSRMFDDMHLAWAGLAASAAIVFCVATMVAMLASAQPERPDSLAGTLQALANPGSNRNPMPLDASMRAPSVDPAVPIPAMFMNAPPDQSDLMLALRAVVTREGRLTDLGVLLANDSDRRQALELLNALSAVKVQPATLRESPVAVNLVWLFAHTTVRGKIHS